MIKGGENARVSPLALTIRPRSQAFFIVSKPLTPTAPFLGSSSRAAITPKFLISIICLVPLDYGQLLQ